MCMHTEHQQLLGCAVPAEGTCEPAPHEHRVYATTATHRCPPPSSSALPQVSNLDSYLSSQLLLAQDALIPGTTFMPWGGTLHVFCSCEQSGLWALPQCNPRLFTCVEPAAVPRAATATLKSGVTSPSSWSPWRSQQHEVC